MKANELRIGNYVLGNVFNSKEFLKTTIERTDFCDLSYLRKCKPIPLTEEWLKRFGFDCVDEINKGYTVNIHSYLDKRLYCSVSGLVALYEKINTKKDFIIGGIKYVHQLQNLYFALTGEELTIKEDETKK